MTAPLYLRIFSLSTPADESVAMKLLNNAEREAASKMDASGRERFCRIRANTRTVLGDYLGCDPASLQVSRSERGKLYLTDRKDVHFSLSHSKDHLALVVADRPLGVDIEEIGRKNRVLDIARRYFCEAEVRWLEQSVNSRADFARLWTLKEALGKMLGTGINPPHLRHSTRIVKGEPEPNVAWLGTATSCWSRYNDSLALSLTWSGGGTLHEVDLVTELSALS